MTPGYNPSAYEPNAHESFSAPSPEVMEKYREVRAIESKKREQRKMNYKQIMEVRKRGQSATLGHYVYEMMYDIYPGIEDKVFEGAIDSHLHIYPDYVPRSVDMIELAINASKAKMAAVVCKDHFFTNVGAAWGGNGGLIGF